MGFITKNFSKEVHVINKLGRLKTGVPLAPVLLFELDPAINYSSTSHSSSRQTSALRFITLREGIILPLYESITLREGKMLPIYDQEHSQSTSHYSSSRETPARVQNPDINERKIYPWSFSMRIRPPLLLFFPNSHEPPIHKQTNSETVSGDGAQEADSRSETTKDPLFRSTNGGSLG